MKLPPDLAAKPKAKPPTPPKPSRAGEETEHHGAAHDGGYREHDAGEARQHESLGRVRDVGLGLEDPGASDPPMTDMMPLASVYMPRSNAHDDVGQPLIHVKQRPDANGVVEEVQGNPERADDAHGMLRPTPKGRTTPVGAGRPGRRLCENSYTLRRFLMR